MFLIGEFAKLNMITVRTLKHYEDLGIFKPMKIDSETGYRFYSASQMTRLNKIISLKKAGFSLNEIGFILKNNEDSIELVSILELKYVEIQEKIRMEKDRLSQLNHLINLYKQDDVIMKYDVILKEVEPIKVASLSQKLVSYEEVVGLWRELISYLRINNVTVTESQIQILEHNEQGEFIGAEVTFSIDNDFMESDRVKIKTLNSESMVTTIHKGSFDTLELAFKAIASWIEDNNYEFVGHQRQLFHHINMDNEDENIVEIQFPVRKK